MGGSAQYVVRRAPPRPVDLDAHQGRPGARPARRSRGRSSRSRSLGASTPTAAWPHRSSASTATASPAWSSRATTCSARATAWPPSRRSTTGRPAMPTGRASCTCASRRPGKTVQLTLDTRIQRLVQQAIAATRGQVARQGGHGRRARHAHRRHPRDGRGAGRAAGGLPRRQSRGVAPARHHRPLRAGLDVQARDLHGRPAGGRDPAEHAVPRARHVHEDVRACTRAHDHGRAPARPRELDGARDPRSLVERRHDHDRREAAGPVASCRSGSRTSASTSSRASTCPGSSPAAPLPRRQVVRHRASSTSRSARASPSRRCRWRRSTPRSPTAAQWIQPHITAAIGSKPDHELAQAPARLAARRPRAARHAHRRRRLRHRHARPDPGVQHRRQDRHDAEVRRQARDATATPTRAIASTRRRSSASRPPSIRASSRS